MACTTILVGRKASYDGSTLIARNEDSANGEFNPKRLVVVKPQDQPRVYKSVLSHVTVELPDNPMQYTSVPNADLREGIWGEAGVNEAKYLEDTTTRVTSENFYWENRIIAALADAAFNDTANAIERYQEVVGSLGHAMVKSTDAAVAKILGVSLKDYEPEREGCECDEGYCDLVRDPEAIIAELRNEDVRAALAKANEDMAAKLKKETDSLLDTVLYITSMRMKNGFNRSDH